MDGKYGKNSAENLRRRIVEREWENLRVSISASPALVIFIFSTQFFISFYHRQVQ
jgi:hypothetical protein